MSEGSYKLGPALQMGVGGLWNLNREDEAYGLFSLGGGITVLKNANSKYESFGETYYIYEPVSTHMLEFSANYGKIKDLTVGISNFLCLYEGTVNLGVKPFYGYLDERHVFGGDAQMKLVTVPLWHKGLRFYMTGGYAAGQAAGDLFHGPLFAFGLTNAPPHYVSGNDKRGYDY